MLPIRTNLPANVLAAMVKRLNGSDPAKVESKIDVVTENVYGKLPRGDYGRGDVRIAILRWAELAPVLAPDFEVGVFEAEDPYGLRSVGHLVIGSEIKTKEDK
tara:strand:- start:832 stop:1140 length:309 start_codon:yes stop_codon:yes gene_type:complete